MKLRSVLFVIILSGFFLSVKAQNFKSDFSEKYRMGVYFDNAVPTANGWLAVKFTYDQSKWYQDVKLISLLLLDSKVNVTKEVSVPVKNNRFLRVRGIYKANGSTFLLYSYKLERKSDDYYIAAQKVNESDLSVEQEISLGQYQSTPGNNTPLFKFGYSVDSSKYFLFNEAIQKPKEPKQFYFKVLDSKMNVLLEKNIEVEAYNRNVYIYKTILDKNDNVYVQYREYEKEAPMDYLVDEDSKIPVYKTIIARYSKTGGSVEVVPDIQGKILHSVSFFNLPSGKMMIAGTYKNIQKKGNVTGIFYGNYDAASNKFDGIQMKEIPVDILALLDNDNIASKGKDAGISANFKPVKLSRRPNGSFDLILEYNMGEMIMHASGGPVSGTTYNEYPKWFSEAILNVNITKDQKVNFTRIPKKQVSEDGMGYLSHASFYYGNKLLFFYDDDKSNFERNIEKRPDDISKFKKSVLMVAVVDENGAVNRQIVYEHDDDKYISFARDMYEVAPGSLLVSKMKTGSFLAFESNKIGMITVTK